MENRAMPSSRGAIPPIAPRTAASRSLSTIFSSSVRPQTPTARACLTILTLHTYFAGSYNGHDVGLAPAGDTQEQEVRLNSTRAFWDPTYTDPGTSAAELHDRRELHVVVQSSAAGSAAYPDGAEMGCSRLPRHQDRLYRIQLGRAGECKRRSGAGRHPGHLRQVWARSRHALGTSRSQ